MTLKRHFRLACLFTMRWTWSWWWEQWLPEAIDMANRVLRFCDLGHPFTLSPDCPWTIFKWRRAKWMPWMHPYHILKCLPSVTYIWCQTCYKNSLFPTENIKPYNCYEISVCAISGDQRGCTSIRGNSKHKRESWDLLPNFAFVQQFGFGGWQKPPVFYFAAPRSGPHINAISEEKGSMVISWNEIPAQEQMGCLLHYRIYWKEQDSNSQPQVCGMWERQMQCVFPI